MIHLDQATFNQKVDDLYSVVGKKHVKISSDLEVIKSKRHSHHGVKHKKRSVSTSKTIDQIFQFAEFNQDRLTQDSVDKLGKVFETLGKRSKGKYQTKAKMGNLALVALLYKNSVREPLALPPPPPALAPPPPPPPLPESVSTQPAKPRIPVGGVNLMAELMQGVKLNHVEAGDQVSDGSSTQTETDPMALIAQQAVNFKLRKTSKSSQKKTQQPVEEQTELSRILEKQKRRSESSRP